MKRAMWTDGEMLEALHLRDRHNLTAQQIADRLQRRFGRKVTKNAIVGLLDRINRETDLSEAAG